MRAPLAGSLALALLAAAAPASAGCGDDSSSDDRSSDTSNDYVPTYYDGGGSDAGSSIAEPACVEVSDTLGESRCRRFGDGWSRDRLPPLRITLAPGGMHLRVGGLEVAGTAVHDEQRFGVATGGRDLRDTDLIAGGLSLRLDVGFFDYLFAGVEVGLFGTDVSGPTRRERDLAIRPLNLLVPSGGAVVGVAIPIDAVTLRLEVYAGMRVVALRSETRRGDCVESTWASTVIGVVEPRAALEVFVLPYLGLGAMVGTNVLEPGEVHGALTLSVHTRAYDSQPR
ncbi:MAG: hypothetical protein KF729_22365 [Sandaracinaceae bacterium]|nr:hypothetical protein [Sandaracinaceae bacterium]